MIVYVLKSALCLSLLYVPYLLLLRRESFCRFNRFMLLGIMLLSAFLPLFDIHPLCLGRGPLSDALAAFVEVGMPVAVSDEHADGYATAVSNLFSPSWKLLSVVYLAGLAVTILYKVVGAVCVYRAVVRGVIWKDSIDGATVYCHVGNVCPFSVFRSVVISESDWQHHSCEVMTHEMGHVVNRHSWDVVFLSVVQTVQWFNPFVWHMTICLREVHEYEADAFVLHSGVDMRGYQTLLIRKVAGTTCNYSYANSFNHSLIKKRFTMMLRKKSSPWMLGKSLYVIPVALLALSAFATSVQEPEPGKGSTVVLITSKAVAPLPTAVDTARAVVSAPDAPDAKEKPYEVVDVMPSYEGGPSGLMAYLSDAVRYPAVAQENGVCGRIVVQFIVEKDGSVSNVHVIKSLIDKCNIAKAGEEVKADASGKKPITEEQYNASVKALEKESERVVSQMKPWIPGKIKGKPVRVKYNIPLSFRLR